MSKYMYTTVYEEFTGIKPPEPKEHKPKRKRGYGHPYRMRLNIQSGAESGNVRPQSHFNEDKSSVNANDYGTITDHYMEQPAGISHEDTAFVMSDAAPRVTYKKRRHVEHDPFSHDAHI